LRGFVAWEIKILKKIKSLFIEAFYCYLNYFADIHRLTLLALKNARILASRITSIFTGSALVRRGVSI